MKQVSKSSSVRAITFVIIISQWGEIIFERAFLISDNCVFERYFFDAFKIEEWYLPQYEPLELFQPIVYLLQKKIVYQDLFPD